jgi:hypothetical protein
MTQARKEALEELLKKVKASGPEPIEDSMVSSWDICEALWPLGKKGVGVYFEHAFDGDPTAAYRFHEMMLPGTHTVLADEASGLGYVAEVFDLVRDGTIGHGHADTRGRALLIADLQALIAQEGEE